MKSDKEKQIEALVEGLKMDAKRTEHPNKRRPKDIAEKRKPIREVETHKKYYGEGSPHWDFVASQQRTIESVPSENVLANPDILSDEDTLYGSKVSAEGEHRLEIIREVMLGLPAQQYKALELCGLQGYTLENAAIEMGVTVRTVRSALARATAKIKRLYERRALED